MDEDSLQAQQHGKHERFGVKLERTVQQGIVAVTAGILSERQGEVSMHALIVMERLIAKSPEAKNSGQNDHANPEPVFQRKRPDPFLEPRQVLASHVLNQVRSLSPGGAGIELLFVGRGILDRSRLQDLTVAPQRPPNLLDVSASGRRQCQRRQQG